MPSTSPSWISNRDTTSYELKKKTPIRPTFKKRLGFSLYLGRAYFTCHASVRDSENASAAGKY